MFIENVGQFAAGVRDTAIAAVLASATQVADGRVHTCALTAGGGVKCWGDNGYGQLGDGTTRLAARRWTWWGWRAASPRIAAGEVSHLCADGGRRGQVLGGQRLRPVGRRHDETIASRRWTWSGWRAA